MNPDFPRIITLLRKERNISQKQAASDLGVSQALLSHYEKGIRECGLDFLVRAADYYNVSCDYLLGRSPEPGGRVVSLDGETERSDISSENKIIRGALGAVLGLAEKTGSKELFTAVYNYLTLSVYKMFRAVFSVNPANDKRMFSIPEQAADDLTNAALSVNCAAAKTAPVAPASSVITTNSVSEDFPEEASMLLIAVKAAEENICSAVNPRGKKEEK
ncbi:MAG: helix-turn-helix domain-containing protein [Oscillospiraceae bacterium]